MSKQKRISFTGIGKPSASSTMRQPPTVCPGAAAGKVSLATKKKLTIPPLSIPPKIPPIDPTLEKLKKKTIRRNAPQGEDIKKIREIIKSIKGESVTVQEYVGLISPYTGDNGNVLRSVMGDDLSSFRRMAKRVYDTMTQDVSDVLANEQINLTDYYNERNQLFMDKMMRTIDEIYRYVPNFNFERYYTDRTYIDSLFPIQQQELSSDPQEREMQRRQAAYHRLQWLRSEGKRLNDENTKLQARLKELKTQQREEILLAKEKEQQAEMRKTQLEETQAELQNQLQELNESFEKSLIQTEEEIRLSEDSKIADGAARKQASRIRSKQQAPKAKGTRSKSWGLQAAKSVEDGAVSTASTSTIAPKTGAVRKTTKPKAKKPVRRVKVKDPWEFTVETPPKRDQQKRELSPFHYSPPRTPPRGERETSPFHYSPPRPPPPGAQDCVCSPQSTARGGPPQSFRADSTAGAAAAASAAAAQSEQSRQFPAARRNLAPRDTWSGFG